VIGPAEVDEAEEDDEDEAIEFVADGGREDGNDGDETKGW